MPDENVIHITVCMGSSCFSRGNNRNIEVIQNSIQNTGAAAKVDISGHLCENQCKLGPNLMINGKTYSEVDPVTVAGLMNQHLRGNDE